MILLLIYLQLLASFPLSAQAMTQTCTEGTPLSYLKNYISVGGGHSCPVYQNTCLIQDKRCVPSVKPKCPDGSIETVPSYTLLPPLVPGGSEVACATPQIACVSLRLCPLPAPISPSFCKDGNVMVRQSGFIPLDPTHSCPAYEVACVKQSLCSNREIF